MNASAASVVVMVPLLSPSLTGASIHLNSLSSWSQFISEVVGALE